MRHHFKTGDLFPHLGYLRLAIYLMQLTNLSFFPMWLHTGCDMLLVEENSQAV